MQLRIEDYPGGLALWGAVPAIYDTTNLPLDKGIHVHARVKSGAKKIIDRSYRKVVILTGDKRYEISELDAIYFMVSSVFGFKMRAICCTRCGWSHLDRDWFSIHPHQTHLCAGCGRTFRDSKISIGNPIAELQRAAGLPRVKTQKSKKEEKIRQKDFPGGIQIWGSNPPILWSSHSAQFSGIHVHAFRNVDDTEPELDETYGSLTIDGIRLNADHVRTYMAQSALPHLAGRVQAVNCFSCGSPAFDKGGDALHPQGVHHCRRCGASNTANGRLRNVIANPIVNILDALNKHSPRPRRVHDLGLIPETL